MPCRQVAEYNGRPGGQKFLYNAGGVFVYAPYQTEAECLGFCKEGACCEGLTCIVKPQCQCQGAGKTFKGVGTACSPSPCLCYCSDGVATLPSSITASLYVYYIAAFYGAVSDATAWRGTYSLQLKPCFNYEATIATPEPYNNFTGFSVAQPGTTTLRLDLSGEAPGMFSILPQLAAGQAYNANYTSGRWVVSGTIPSIVCAGGTVKRFWAQDAGYTSAYVEISANPLP